MLIENLFASQEDIRNIAQVKGIIDFVKNEGILNDKSLEIYASKNSFKKSPLINIARFSDNKLMIHDGHHRCVAIYLAGRDFLYEDEFFVNDWSYKDYEEINFEKNWLTPFSPIEEVRIADFYSFKEKVNELYLVSEQIALDYIFKNRKLYCKKREIFNFENFANKIFNKLN